MRAWKEGQSQGYASLEDKTISSSLIGNQDPDLDVEIQQISQMEYLFRRTKTITEVSQDGQTISTITHEDLKEPVDIAIDGEGNILVADNGIGSILVLEPSGKLMRNIGSPGTDRGHFKDLSSVTVALNGDIVVADSRIQVYTRIWN